jgi:hypothetical protein
MPRAMYICPVCHKNVLASKAIHIKPDTIIKLVLIKNQEEKKRLTMIN